MRARASVRVTRPDVLHKLQDTFDVAGPVHLRRLRGAHPGAACNRLAQLPCDPDELRKSQTVCAARHVAPQAGQPELGRDPVLEGSAGAPEAHAVHELEHLALAQGVLALVALAPPPAVEAEVRLRELQHLRRGQLAEVDGLERRAEVGRVRARGLAGRGPLGRHPVAAVVAGYDVAAGPRLPLLPQPGGLQLGRGAGQQQRLAHELPLDLEVQLGRRRGGGRGAGPCRWGRCSPGGRQGRGKPRH
mmetsp:Transcript_67587/g.190523  ORF Transcript_67587/g.190523 Transcript_67587/m.190523 type:complete len:246 (-) Transcript_67587:52-789(-)